MGVIKKRIPYEIKSYESTMIYGLTVRQVICVVGALGLAVPTGYFGGKFLSSDTVGYIIMFEVVPFAAAGWLKYNDMHIEKIAVKAFQFYFGTQKRQWIWNSPEVQLHELETEIALDELTKEREQELAEEKAAAKQRKAAMKKIGMKKRNTDSEKGEMNDAG